MTSNRQDSLFKDEFTGDTAELNHKIMRSSKDIISGSFTVLVVSLVSSIAGFCSTVLLSRNLGVSDYGSLMSLFSAAILAGSICDLGISRTIVIAVRDGLFRKSESAWRLIAPQLSIGLVAMLLFLLFYYFSAKDRFYEALAISPLIVASSLLPVWSGILQVDRRLVLSGLVEDHKVWFRIVASFLFLCLPISQVFYGSIGVCSIICATCLLVFVMRSKAFHFTDMVAFVTTPILGSQFATIKRNFAISGGCYSLSVFGIVPFVDFFHGPAMAGFVVSARLVQSLVSMLPSAVMTRFLIAHTTLSAFHSIICDKRKVATSILVISSPLCLVPFAAAVPSLFFKAFDERLALGFYLVMLGLPVKLAIALASSFLVSGEEFSKRTRIDMVVTVVLFCGALFAGHSPVAFASLLIGTDVLQFVLFIFVLLRGVAKLTHKRDESVKDAGL